MPSRNKSLWRTVVLRIIAPVAVILITLMQLRFTISYDGCDTLPDASISIFSLGDLNSDNINKTDNLRHNVRRSASLENEILAIEEHSHAKPLPQSQPEPDGTFMNHPIYYRSPAELQSFHSTAHCIGDNFIKKDSWKSKTCQFQNLCFDTISHDFVIFASPEQLELERILSNRDLTDFSASSSMNTSVSIGGINAKWSKSADVPRMEWFPALVDVKHILTPDSEKEGGVYVLPQDVVMVPFHSFAGMNVGHLIWDDWLPLYTILETFDYLDKEPLFIRYMQKDAMWASCDYHKNIETCAKMMSKFLPLLGVGDPNSKNKLFTIHDFNFTANGEPTKSRYVCGKNGLAGLGMLTDHGENMHGWGSKDYENSHNTNRGASLYRFRNHMLSNIGVSTAPLQNINKKAKFKIVFSINSSSNWARMTSFNRHAKRLKELDQKYNMEIIMANLSRLKLVEQLELMSTTSILVTVCGGGAVSAAFLPKGAALFVLFNDEEGIGLTPARLDWDMFNHLGYIRTHWLPRVRKSFDTKRLRASTTDPLEVDFDAFVKLVDHELDTISHL